MRVNNLYYWSEHFRNPTWETCQVPVRYDPFDVGVAYAFIDGQWVECHSEYYSAFHGHSEREVQLASEELRKRHENHSGQFVITARKLAAFLESVELEEALLIQRLSDLEAWSLLTQPGSSTNAADHSSDRCHESPPVMDMQPPADPPAVFPIYGEI
jgi:hypothetical protein